MEDKTRYVLYVVILGLVLGGLGSIFSQTLTANQPNRVPLATFFLVCIFLFLILFNYERSKTPRHLERTLIKRVSDAWITDLVNFKKGLPNGALFPIRLSFCEDGIAFPRTVKSNSKVADLTLNKAFESTRGSLLVLGEAGSGKTVSLLALTGELIEKARKDPSAPIPVFLSLSTWKRGSLESWLVNELRNKYDVAEEISRSWILGKRLLFLLDDLGPRQSACIQLINAFLNQIGSQGLVIAARNATSESKLNLNGAIRLEKLCEDFVRRVLPQLNSEHAADDGMVQISRSPLILRLTSFAPHAVFDRLRHDLKSPADDDVVKAYVDHQLELAPKLNPPYASAELKKWLSWLATSSRHLSHTVFAIDDLQPNWLRHCWHCAFYVFLSRSAGALTVMAMGVGLMKFSEAMGRLVRSDAYSFHFINVHAALWEWFLITVIIGGLTIGAVDYFRLVVWPVIRFSPDKMKKFLSFTSDLLPRSLAWSNLIIYFLAFWISAKAFFGLPTATNGAAAYGVAFALTYWNRARERKLDTDISTAHKLVWTATHIPEGFLWGLIAGYCFGMLFIVYEVIGFSSAGLILAGPSIIAFLLGLVLFRPNQDKDRGMRAIINSRFEAGLVGATVVGIVNVLRIWSVHITNPQVVGIDPQVLTRGLKILGLFCLLGTIVGLIVRGLRKVSIVEERTRHEGLKTSLRTTILLWLSVGVPIVLLLWGYSTRVMGKDQTFKESLFFGMMLGMLFGFSYGGLDLIYRVVLRIILRMRGDVPFFYSTVLDDAANLGLLRKVGHAYVFYHDSVRKYLCKQYRQSSKRDGRRLKLNNPA